MLLAQPDPTLPEVTEAHRLAAFEAMGWVGWTYAQAMANDTRHRVIEARAHQLRTAEWKLERKPVYTFTTGYANFLPGYPNRRFYILPTVDLKRAAAGDFDD